MPRTCTICNHPSREAIEKALLAGDSFRNVAKRFETSTTALYRHKSDHLAASLVKAKDAADLARADSVLAEIRAQVQGITNLYTEAQGILQDARKAKDLPTALKAIRELSNLHRETRATLELVAQITGEMEKAKQEAAQVNVGQAVIFAPPPLPPGAPCNLDPEYWRQQGFLGPMAAREQEMAGLPEAVVDAEVVDV